MSLSGVAGLSTPSATSTAVVYPTQKAVDGYTVCGGEEGHTDFAMVPCPPVDDEVLAMALAAGDGNEEDSPADSVYIPGLQIFNRDLGVFLISPFLAI